jgi:hypothetical protein
VEYCIFRVGGWNAVIGVDDSELRRVLERMHIETEQEENAAERLQPTVKNTQVSREFN